MKNEICIGMTGAGYLKVKKKKNSKIISIKHSNSQNNLKDALNKFKQEIKKPNNFIQIIQSCMAFFSLWNSLLGTIIQTVLSTILIGINIHSEEKIERRLILIGKTIEKIIRKQQTMETNYEAALICPELFRNALIIEDEDRVKEHLALIEMLYSSNKFNFDDLAETLRLVNQLSGMEYKILKLIPPVYTKWEEILEINELSVLYDTQKERLTAAFLSLVNMNLVVKKSGIRRNGSLELGTISFDDDIEYIRLSEYGKLFLDSMKEIITDKKNKGSQSNNIVH